MEKGGKEVNLKAERENQERRKHDDEEEEEEKKKIDLESCHVTLVLFD